MKKYFLPVIISIGFALFSFTACDNFMKSDLIDSLDQKIEYENYQTFNIRVNVDSVNHGSVYCSKTTSLRKTDIVELEFTPAADYTFIRWNVTDAATKTKDYSNCLKIYAPERTITTLEVVDTNEDILKNGVLVRPVCVKTIGFTNKSSPAVSDTTSYPCDTSPDLYLTSNLSKNNDWDKIEIKLTNPIEDGKRYFEFKPMTADAMNNICYMAKTGEGERIEVSSASTRTVTISLPADFKYVVEETGEEKEFGKVISYTYNINYQTQDKTSIDIGITNDENPADKEMGTLRVEGQSGTSFRKSYNIGESFTVAFSLNPAYIFEGWECSNSSAVKILYPKDANGYNQYFDDEGNPSYYDSVTNMYYATVTVINSDANVKVTAKAKQIPHRDIKFYSSEGKISPNATVDKKVGDKVPLTFTSDPDFCFTYWAVKVGNDVLSKEEGLKYFKFDNIEEPDTTVTFAKDIDSDELISIVPVCVLRPKVLYNIPSYNADGVYRDSRIQVLFDHDMDIESIYYTESELAGIKNKLNLTEDDEYSSDDLTSRLKKNEILPEKGLLYIVNGWYGERKYYGYIENGAQTYKNIKISNMKTGESMLEQFAAPEFEKPNLLVITSMGQVYGPEKFSQMVVEISKDVYFSAGDNQYQIAMASNLKWSYYVNESADSLPPSMTISVKAHDKENQKRAISRQIGHVPGNAGESMNAYISDGKIYADITVSDSASLPSDIVSLKAKRIKDEYYDDLTTSPELTITAILENRETTQKLTGTDVVFDMSDESLYPDGVYKVYFVATDNNKNPAYSYNYTDAGDTESNGNENYYYFLLVRNGPKIKNLAGITDITDIELDWDTPVMPYYKQINKATNLNDDYFETLNDSGITDCIFTNLDPATTYSFSVEAEDIFGHKATTTTKKNTAPKAPSVASVSGAKDNSIDIAWRKPETVAAEKGFSGIRVMYSQNSNFSSYAYKDFESTASSGTGTITGLTKGTTYYFRFKTIDGEQTSSNEYATPSSPLNTLPYAVSAVTEDYSKQTKNSVTLSWSKPSSMASVNGYNGAVVYYKKAGESSYNTSKFEVTGTNTVTIKMDSSNFNYGDYTFKVHTKDGYGGISTTGIEKNVTIKPHPVSNYSVSSGYHSYGDGMSGVNLSLKWNAYPSTQVYDGYEIEYNERTIYEAGTPNEYYVDGYVYKYTRNWSYATTGTVVEESNLMREFNKLYVVKVRAYANLNGDKHYSEWSEKIIHTAPTSVSSVSIYKECLNDEDGWDEFSLSGGTSITSPYVIDDLYYAKLKFVSADSGVEKYRIVYTYIDSNNTLNSNKTLIIEKDNTSPGRNFEWNIYNRYENDSGSTKNLAGGKYKLDLYAVNEDGCVSNPWTRYILFCPNYPKNLLMTITTTAQQNIYSFQKDTIVGSGILGIYYASNTSDIINNKAGFWENTSIAWDETSISNRFFKVVNYVKYDGKRYESASINEEGNRDSSYFYTGKLTNIKAGEYTKSGTQYYMNITFTTPSYVTKVNLYYPSLENKYVRNNMSSATGLTTNTLYTKQFNVGLNQPSSTIKYQMYACYNPSANPSYCFKGITETVSK